MTPKQPTTRQLKARVKEEKQTSREYRKEGFIKQANQEMQHAKFFEKKIKKQLCK